MTREDEPATRDITLELKLQAPTLQRLKPGSKIQLKVQSMEGPSGEALVGTTTRKSIDMYDFMYDADSESNSGEEEELPTISKARNQQKHPEPLMNDLKDGYDSCEDDSDDSCPCLVSMSGPSEDDTTETSDGEIEANKENPSCPFQTMLNVHSQGFRTKLYFG